METRTSRFKHGQIAKSFFIILLTFFLSAFFVKSYALPFDVSIIPNAPLPTNVVAGSTVSASYMVINNSAAQRNNTYVKYLPPNVSIGPGGCTNTFTLAPAGQPGDSCILNLIISGAVSALDPNPHHHLFVCLPGGIACAGTEYPLNVSLITGTVPSIAITPLSASVGTGNTQQYNAIATFANGVTQNVTGSAVWNSSNPAVATINSAGLATGITVGSTNITATFLGGTSNTAALNVTPTMVSVGYYSDSLGNGYGLSYFTNSGGNTWTQSAGLTQTNVSLSAVACNSTNSNCTAIGNNSTTSVTVPISYITTNNGRTWSLSATSPPGLGTANNLLNGASCDSTGLYCTAVGSYANSGNPSVLIPLTYYSTDGGNHWLISTILPPTQSANSNSLSSVACGGAVATGVKCAAIGTYNNGTNNIPLSYYSINGGKTWTVSAALPVPSNTNVQLNSIACDTLTGLKCNAVGNNVTTGTPISYTSTSGGSSWSTSSTLPPPQTSGFNYLYGVACDMTGTICTAVGYSTTSGDYAPLSYYSTNGGGAWTVSPGLPPLIHPSDTNDGLSSVTCNTTGLLCTAVGGYVSGSSLVPLSYITLDGGHNWTASTQQPTPPPLSVNATLTDAS